MERHSDRRDPAWTFSSFVAGIERWLPAGRGRHLAYAALAQADHGGPPDECGSPEAQGSNQTGNSVDMASAAPQRGLSLPARAWIIVGAAAALWGVLALAATLFL